jgi:hypothetical protein
MAQEYPFHVIQRHCQNAGVQPIEMLALLLEGLQQRHQMEAGITGFATGAENHARVTREIQGLMGLLRKDLEPTSLLATMELSVQVQYLLDSTNSKNANAPAEQREALARRAKAEAALQLVIRDLINQAEAQGLQLRMKLEEGRREKGWTLLGEDGEPEAPQG